MGEPLDAGSGAHAGAGVADTVLVRGINHVPGGVRPALLEHVLVTGPAVPGESPSPPVPLTTLASPESSRPARAAGAILAAAFLGLLGLAVVVNRSRVPRAWLPVADPSRSAASRQPRGSAPDAPRPGRDLEAWVEDELAAIATEVRRDRSLPGTCRDAVAAACRRTPPFRTVNRLGRAVGRDRRTLWRTMHAVIGPKELLDHVLLLRAVAEKKPRVSWGAVASRLGVSARTLRRVAGRCAGCTLGELRARGPGPLVRRLRRHTGLEPRLGAGRIDRQRETS